MDAEASVELKDTGVDEPPREIKKWADDKFMSEIARIEAEQAPEILKAIFNTYNDDMLIRWKTDAFKIIQRVQKQQPEKKSSSR